MRRQESNSDLQKRWVELCQQFYVAMYDADGRAVLGPDADTPEQRAFAAWMAVDDELWWATSGAIVPKGYLPGVPARELALVPNA